MSNTPFNQGEFCWNELMTADTHKAKAFYSALLGWQTEEMNVNGVIYTAFKNGDKGVAGMMAIPQEELGKIPPHWMSYINVDNVDTYAAKAAELGASIVVPPSNVSDFGRFVVLQDPTGAHIALWQVLKVCE